MMVAIHEKSESIPYKDKCAVHVCQETVNHPVSCQLLSVVLYFYYRHSLCPVKYFNYFNVNPFVRVFFSLSVCRAAI